MRKDLLDQVREKCALVQRAVAHVKPHPLGHAFLWGIIEVKLKNGKSRFVKECLGMVCAEDLDACVKLAQSVPGVTGVYYNLD